MQCWRRRRWRLVATGGDSAGTGLMSYFIARAVDPSRPERPEQRRVVRSKSPTQGRTNRRSIQQGVRRSESGRRPLQRRGGLQLPKDKGSAVALYPSGLMNPCSNATAPISRKKIRSATWEPHARTIHRSRFGPYSHTTGWRQHERASVGEITTVRHRIQGERTQHCSTNLIRRPPPPPYPLAAHSGVQSGDSVQACRAKTL